MAWSTARKNAARDNAERLGELQKFIVASPLFALFAVVGFFAGAGLLIGGIEHTF